MRFILFITIMSFLTFSNLGIAGSPDAAVAQNDDGLQETDEFLASSVDGVMVPNEVLSYVQLEYQGFAVIHANETYGNDGMQYKLTVGKDIFANGDSFYLMYTKDWKLIGKEEVVIPEPEYFETEVREKVEEVEESYEDEEEDLEREIEQLEREVESIEAERNQPDRPEPSRHHGPPETPRHEEPEDPFEDEDFDEEFEEQELD